MQDGPSEVRVGGVICHGPARSHHIARAAEADNIVTVTVLFLTRIVL